MSLFIGLMSGTGMDAVDAALIGFTSDKAQLLEFHQLPVPKDLRADSKIPCHCIFAPYSPKGFQALERIELAQKYGWLSKRRMGRAVAKPIYC
jgi:1,6-anhydro-N-acetylmuramate kinase